jgi:hypothetical protein
MATHDKTIAADLHLGKGIKLLSPDLAEQADIDLGPLTNLVGEWISVSALSQQAPSGWNVISVPGRLAIGEGFVLDVIPYTEKLSFKPVVVAGNRGLFTGAGTQENVQQINGLLYEQVIHSMCPADTPGNQHVCNKMGFPNGTEIHAERGLFLYLTNFDSGYSIARLSVIPHGNSLLALGNSGPAMPPFENFIPPNSILPSQVFGPDQFRKQQFPELGFDQLNPNSFLTNTLGSAQVNGLTVLEFDTAYKVDNVQYGGILNIPFIQQNVNAVGLNATFWIESIANTVAGQPDILQLQYSQTITLEFAPTGIPGATHVQWPHVTINTLRKLTA